MQPPPQLSVRYLLRYRTLVWEMQLQDNQLCQLLTAQFTAEQRRRRQKNEDDSGRKKARRANRGATFTECMTNAVDGTERLEMSQGSLSCVISKIAKGNF